MHFQLNVQEFGIGREFLGQIQNLGQIRGGPPLQNCAKFIEGLEILHYFEGGWGSDLFEIYLAALGGVSKMVVVVPIYYNLVLKIRKKERKIVV